MTETTWKILFDRLELDYSRGIRTWEEFKEAAFSLIGGLTMIDLKGLTWTDGWRDCVERITQAVEMGLSYEEAVNITRSIIEKHDEGTL